MRAKIIKIYSVIGAIGIAYWLWIQLTGLMLPCFYLTTTGYQCPGCGSTRMFLSLLELDFAAAFAHNPVVFVLFFLWNLVALLGLTEKIRFVQNKYFLYSLFGFSIAALVIFGIYRIFA